MIVNPQEFNYRITIGILVVVIAVFTAYGLTSYASLKSDNDFLAQGKTHLHSELHEILNRYDDLNAENLTLKSQLDSTLYQVGLSSMTIDKLKAKIALNKSLQNQLNALSVRKSSLQEHEDSLIRVITHIEKEKQSIIEELNSVKQNALVEKQTLENKIEKASVIFANSFIAKAYKIRGSKKPTQTFKAKDTEEIELCFVIAQNAIAPRGDKDLYIQIIDPNNNVLSDKGSVNFGDESLIYSYKESVHYSNTAIDVCLNIKNEEVFKPGLYYINVFENNRRLGGTKIELE
jgi:hypothetical protein